MTFYSYSLLINDFFTQLGTSDEPIYAPLTLTLDPRNISTNNKIKSIEYIWGDGTSTILNYKPIRNDQIDVSLPFPNDIGDVRNYAVQKDYFSNIDSNNSYVIQIKVHQFNTDVVDNYNIMLQLTNPPMDYSSIKFLDEIHLVKTKMFGVDNKILYTFEAKKTDYVSHTGVGSNQIDPVNTYPLMTVINWNDIKPTNVMKAIQNSRPYKIIKPFESKFNSNSGINTFTYNKQPYNPDDDTPIQSLM